VIAQHTTDAANALESGPNFLTTKVIALFENAGIADPEIGE
jgi:hypothetical protein